MHLLLAVCLRWTFHGGRTLTAWASGPDSELRTLSGPAHLFAPVKLGSDRARDSALSGAVPHNGDTCTVLLSRRLWDGASTRTLFFTFILVLHQRYCVCLYVVLAVQ